MKCSIWASWKISKLSLAVFPKHAKPCSFQQRCQKPSNASVFSLWKSQNTLRLRPKNWQLIWLINTIFVSKRVKSLIPWLDWWTSSSLNLLSFLVGPNVGSMSWRVAWRFVVSGQKGFTEIWIKTNVSEYFVTLKMGTWTSWLQQTLRRVVWIFQVWLMSTTTIFHKIQKAMFTGSDEQVVLGKQVNPLPLYRQMKWAICKSLRTWPKSGWREWNLQQQKKPSKRKNK